MAVPYALALVRDFFRCFSSTFSGTLRTRGCPDDDDREDDDDEEVEDD
jgi:hypothetical protein